MSYTTYVTPIAFILLISSSGCHAILEALIEDADQNKKEYIEASYCTRTNLFGSRILEVEFENESSRCIQNIEFEVWLTDCDDQILGSYKLEYDGHLAPNECTSVRRTITNWDNIEDVDGEVEFACWCE